MEDGLNVPTCVLKVNIQCCAACPKKVKKKLQKINDVYAINIDTQNGLVSVRGIVQPFILIQTILEKVGKKAELYSYEKNPKIQNQMLDQGNSCSACKYEENNQTCSFTDESNDQDKGEEQEHDHQDVYNEVKDPILEAPKGSLSWQWHHPQHGMRKKKHGFAGWFGKKSTVEPRMFGNLGGTRSGYARLPPPPSAPPLPPPPAPLPPPSYPYSPP